jgi:hypothetical protein
LNEHGVLYVLAGGVAANLHGVVRSTKDVGILVPRDRAIMQRLLEALSKLPNGVARELDVDDVIDKPIVIVGDDPRVDVLTVAWDLRYDEAKSSAVVRTIEGVTVPYLSLKDLIRSKRMGRHQDLADIEILQGLDAGEPR